MKPTARRFGCLAPTDLREWEEQPTQKAEAVKGRIMFVESKAGGLEGDARIGRVSFSKTGRTIYYACKKFQSQKGAGFKSNYFDVENRENYWISGPKKDGNAFLYGGGGAEIDEDVRVEYWTQIRNQPSRVKEPIS